MVASKQLLGGSTGRMQDGISQTDEGKWGKESEFLRDGQGLTCEKTPQQSSGGTQSPACIQQEEEDRPSPKEKATKFKCCARHKSSRNPPRPLSLGYRVDRLRKQAPAPGRDPTLSKAKVTQ